MLFRSLLSRISRVIPGVRLGFGGNSGAEPGAKISFLKYPGLVSLLSSLLSPSQNTCDAETESSEIVTARVFPALELIGQKIPGSRSVDDSLLRQLVTQQLKSPVWAIREHAARVYASLLSLSDILDDIPELLEFDRDVAAQNFLHGKALGVKYALRRLAFASDIKWEGT